MLVASAGASSAACLNDYEQYEFERPREQPSPTSNDGTAGGEADGDQGSRDEPAGDEDAMADAGASPGPDAGQSPERSPRPRRPDAGRP